MKAADIPTRFPIPFADSAGGSYTRPIPQASQIGIENGAASLTDGFPPLNFIPVGAGGVPPLGEDFNGLLNQITLWSQWQAAAGPVPYDATFSAAIGGYPKGTVLAGLVDGVCWRSTADDNTSDPDTGGADWTKLISALSAVPGWTYAADTGAANAITVALSPPALTLVAGMALRIKVLNALTGASTVTVDANTAKALKRSDGSATRAKDIFAGQIVEVIYDGTNFQLMGSRQYTPTFWRLDSPLCSLSNGVLTQITAYQGLTQSVEDTVADPSSGNVTIGTKDAGLYVLLAGFDTNGSASAEEIVLFVNGTVVASNATANAANQSILNQSTSTIYTLNAGDVVNVSYSQTSGGARNTSQATLDFFAGVKIG